MAQRQGGSARVAWTKVGTRESGGDELDDNVSLLAGRRKPRFTCMVIGWGLTGGATGTAFASGDC
jgi:hypothetical protein